MKDFLTRTELAEFLGIFPLTVDYLTAHEGLPEGLPVATTAPASDAGTKGAPSRTSWRVGRRELSEWFGLHEDTLTGKLPAGLGAAVLEPGGRGARAVFDARLAFKWHAAQTDRLSELVRRDFEVCARAGVLAIHHLPASLLLGAPTRRARS